MQLSKRPDPSDQALFVEFHDEPKIDPVATKAAGMDQYKDVVYCKIVVDPFTVNDGPVKDSPEYSDIKRFPDAWELFKAKKNGERIGTPLKLLTGMTPAKLKNYENADIYSVEQLATSADQTVTKFMGGLADRKEAIKHLEAAKESYKEAEIRRMLEMSKVSQAAQDEKIAEQDKIIKSLMAQMAESTKPKSVTGKGKTNEE